MGRRGLIVAIVGLGIVALAILLREARDAPPGSPAASEPALLAPAAALPDARPPELAVAEAAPSPLQAEASEPLLLPASGTATTAAHCTWRGRLIAPDGLPASGVPWQMEASVGSTSLSGSSGTTGDDGRFEARFDLADEEDAQLRFDPPSAVPITLADRAPFTALQLDLGDVQLEAGGTIVGRVVDVEGHIVPGAWSVLVSYGAEDYGERPRRWSRPAKKVDEATGTFEVRGIRSGTPDVCAQLGLATADGREEAKIRATAQQLVTVIADEVSDVTLVYAGPVLARQLVVIVRGVDDRPCFDVDPAVVRLVGPAGALPDPRRLDHGSEKGQLQFVDVPAGTYTLEIRDPAHRPWSASGVHPGPEPLLAELEGSCTLDLQVTDAADGSPVETFGVSALITRRTEQRAGGRLLSATTSSSDPGLGNGPGKCGPHPGGGLTIDRLPVDALQVHVTAPGFADVEVTWPGAPAEGRDTLCVALQRSRCASVAGRVLEADGTPAAGAQVGLFFGEDGGLTERFVSETEFWTLDLGPPGYERAGATTHTDANGDFLIEVADVRPCHVRAWRSSVVDAWLEVQNTGGQAVTGLELRLPASAELAGRLNVGDSPPTGPWGLALRPADDVALAERAMPPSALSDRAGRFRFAALRSGAWDVFALALPRDSVGWQPLRLTVPEDGAAGPALFDYVQSPGEACTYLGRVRVPVVAGDVVFDLAAVLPGSLRVRALRGAEPLENACVSVWRSRGTSDQSCVAQVLSGSDGWASIAPLAAGAYTVETCATPNKETVADERRINLGAGERMEWSVSIDLRRAVLLCVDAAGSPLPETAVRVWCRSGDTWRPQYGRTDATGRLALELPPGELRVGRLPPADAGLVGADAADEEGLPAFMRLMLRSHEDVQHETWTQDVPVAWGQENRDIPVTLPPAPP